VDPADVEAVAVDPATPVRCTDATDEALGAAREALDIARDAGDPIYGLTTGFGPLVTYPADPHDAPDASDGDASDGVAPDDDAVPASPDADSGLGAASPSRTTGPAAGLLNHLSTGAGDLAEPPVVRAMIAARLQSLAQGYSAVRRPVFDALLGLLENEVTPAVPEIGSLGASGDLTPLAYVARVLTGDGEVLGDDGPRPAAGALREAGLEPVTLDGRDALALVNGTSFMTGLAALGLVRAQRLIERTEALTGWAYRLLGCSLDALDARLHAARGHAGQLESAGAIHDEATRDGPAEQNDRPLQEVYSLRCAPQLLGAARDQLQYVRRIVTTELNGVNDNPVVVPDGPDVLHGGNFQGQQIAFAADALNAAVTQIGVLAERQVDLLLTPDQNGGAPPLLAWSPGTTSGLAGAQLTATALVAELRHDAQMSATASIPTNGDNQDVVSMGAMAARRAYEQTEHAAPILAVLGLALAQLTHLRDAGRADGPAPAPPPWMPDVAPIVDDRPLRSEITTLATRWLNP
jgi:histidine ammonia-lyase/tyrosine ammonia-lyase